MTAKRMVVVLVTVVAVAVTAAGIGAGFGVVGAQGDSDTTTTCPLGVGGYGLGWGGRGDILSSPQVILAQTLGMTLSELRTDLEAGKSIADIAAEQGVELSTIVDALVAPRTETLTQLVNARVMTQEEANACVAQMTENLTEQLSTSPSEHRNGDGFGRRGPSGRHGFGFGIY
jgi:hypothetical protein